MTYDYEAFGLRLRLPFRSELMTPLTSTGAPDVVVTLAPIPEKLDDEPMVGTGWQASPKRFLYYPAWGAGRFLVEHGRTVTVERLAGGDDETLALQFVGTVLGMILRQRGLVVIHGTSASDKRGAITVCGNSGAGKSTTLRSLMARGWGMLSDDYSVLAPTGSSVDVRPGIPRMHLSNDAAHKLGVDVEGLRSHLAVATKSIVPTRDAMATQPARLRALFLLQIHDGDEVEARPLTGVEKFMAIRRSYYFAPVGDAEGEEFAALAAVAERTRMIRILRPANTWSVDRVVDAIDAELHSMRRS